MPRRKFTRPVVPVWGIVLCNKGNDLIVGIELEDGRRVEIIRTVTPESEAEILYHFVTAHGIAERVEEANTRLKTARKQWNRPKAARKPARAQAQAQENKAPTSSDPPAF